MGSGTGKRRSGASSVLAICLLAGMLVLPAAANAQTSATTQYTPDVGTAGATATGGTGNSPNSGAAGANDSGGVAGEAQSGGGGSLPFTGYPLTSLVLLVAILLAAGLTLRVLMPRLDRRHI